MRTTQWTLTHCPKRSLAAALLVSGLLGLPQESRTQALECEPEFEVTSLGSSPGVAISGDGDVLIAWKRRNAPIARFFDTKGDPASEEMALGEGRSRFGSDRPSLAANEGGDFVAAWTAADGPDDPAGSSVFVSRLTAGAKRALPGVRVSGVEKASLGRGRSISIDQQGRAVVLWTAGSEVWGRAPSGPRGNPWVRSLS